MGRNADITRNTAIAAVALALLGANAGCGDAPPTERPDAPVTQRAPAPAPRVDAEPPPPDPLRDQPELPAERRTLLIKDGELRVVDRVAAIEAGYTLLDLRDDWTPYIFVPQHAADGRELPNRYRSIYLGLAKEETDGDGHPLDDDAHQFLELYGIPPSMSVLRERFFEDEARDCFGALDYEAMSAVERVAYRQGRLKKRHEREIRMLDAQISKAMEAHAVESRAELVAKQPDLEDEIAAVERAERQIAAHGAAVQRLKCEGLLAEKTKVRPMEHPRALIKATEAFQRRHMIYEFPYFRPQTMATLARSPRANNFDAFRRVIRERVVAATHIIEDGSVEAEWVDAKGRTHTLRNLVEEFTDAAMEQLGVTDGDTLAAFFEQFGPEDFRTLSAAIRFPALPEYYGPEMDLEIVIDRGDVWYDPPWDEEGRWHAQRRANMPRFYVYLNLGEQRFPLVKWATTIGGWRAEQASNGYEYYKYKGSDVGPRSMRKVISGPVWIAPESTPLRGMVRWAKINGRGQRIVNYDEMGPGYLSAYGLVAGYFVIPGRDGRPDYDRGIRAHGTSDYMSTLHSQKYSHGCHRLMNHLAVRVYGFILNHRNVVVDGDQPMGYSRQFLWKDEVYEVRIPTRGFQFTLDPPMQVNVLKGRIRGTAREPIEGFIPKPDLEYPPGPVPGTEPESAESRAGGGGGGDDT